MLLERLISCTEEGSIMLCTLIQKHSTIFKSGSTDDHIHHFRDYSKPIPSFAPAFAPEKWGLLEVEAFCMLM